MSKCDGLFGCRGWISSTTVDEFLRKLLEGHLEGVDLCITSCPIEKNSHEDGVSFDDIYLSIRRQLSSLKRQRPRSPRATELVEDVCRHVRFFMVQVCARLDRSREADGLELRTVRDCWRYVKGLVMQFGFIADEPLYRSMEFDLDRESASNARTRFHLHLEVIILTCVFAETVHRKYPQFIPPLSSEVIMHQSIGGSLDIWSDTGNFAIVNLVGPAAVRFSQSLQSETINWLALLSTSPFQCHCVADALWFLQQRMRISEENFPALLDFLGKAIGVLNKVAACKEDYARSDVLSSSALVPVKDVSGFSSWMLFHLLPTVDQFPQWKLALRSDEQFEKNFASKLVQPVMSELDSLWNEPKARFLVACLYRLQECGSIQQGSLALLLDLFLKNLSRSFSLDSKSADSMQVLQQDSLRWADKWNNLEPVHIGTVRSETSFDLFLRALAIALTESNDTWKRIKGRLLSKFHSRYLETLTETAWSRLFDILLLLVGKTQEHTSIAARFCGSVTENAWSDSKTVIGRNAVIWRGLLAWSILSQRSGISAAIFLEKLASEFGNWARYLKGVRDISTVSCIWSLIAIYLDALELTFSSDPSCLSSVALLISPGFGDLFQCTLDETKEEKLHATLESLLDLYARHFPFLSEELSSQHALHHQEFLSSFFANILPAVRKLAVTKRRGFLGCIPYAADKFTRFSMVYSHSDNRSGDCSVIGLVNFFACSDEVSSQVTVQYLTRILEGQREIDFLMERMDSTQQSRLVHSWVRCVVELGEESAELCGLSEKIVRLPELAPLDIDLGDPLLVFPKFLEKCGQLAENSFSSETRTVWLRRCQIYFADIGKYVGSVLRQNSSPARTESIVRITGMMFKHCSRLLYVRGRLNNPLRHLADLLLLPTDNASLLPPLRNDLPLYVCGLSRLDFQNDVQLKDILAAVVRTYLVKLNSCPVDLHPLLVSVRDSITVSPKLGSFVTRVICQSFLSPVSLPQPTSIAVAFLQKLIVLVPLSDFMDSVEVLFDHSLGVYLKGTEILRNSSLVLLKQAVAVCGQKPSENVRNVLAKSLREKCLAGSNAQPGNLFILLDWISQKYSDLLRDVLPFLTQMFVERSANYPAYQTAKTRQSYVALLTRLGPLGQKELDKLPK